MPAIRGGKGANSAIAGPRQRLRGSPLTRFAGTPPEGEHKQRPSPPPLGAVAAKRSEGVFAA